MRWRLNSAEGRSVYARRKAVVEPVNGQIKHARGVRQFSFRGRNAVEAEWQLVSLCHNLLKLFAHRQTLAHTRDRKRDSMGRRGLAGRFRGNIKLPHGLNTDRAGNVMR